MEGVEGQIFGPMARTYGYALAGALIATFTITPVLASFFLPEQVKETETFVVRSCTGSIIPPCVSRLAHRAAMVGVGVVFLAVSAFLASRLGSEFLPALGRGQFLDSRLDAHDPLPGGRRSRHEKNAPDSPAPSRSHHGRFPTWPA